MKKNIAILGLLLGLGALLFFLQPSEEEQEIPKEELEEIKPETVATLNPLLNFALQGGETQILESWNKASSSLYSKIKNVIVKIRLKASPDNIRGVGVLAQGGGAVLTTCRNLEKAKDIEIVCSDGSVVPVAFLAKDSERGATILKTLSAPIVASGEIGEGMAGGEILMKAEWDDILGDVKINISFVLARPADKSLLFSNPDHAAEVLLFNTQGKFVGIRGRVEVRERDDYLTLAGGRLSQWVKTVLPPPPSATSSAP